MSEHEMGISITPPPVVSPDMSASVYLKESTKGRHRQVDRHQTMSMLMSPSLTVSVYTKILKALYLWLSDLEFSLSHLGLSDPYRPGSKLSLLENDLLNLGETIPPKKSLSRPSLESSFCLGVHYVVEGSTLGAQYIAPRVEKNLNRDNITHYLRGYGSEVDARWQFTSAFLDKSLASETSKQRAVDGALFAFDLLLAILNNREDGVEPYAFNSSSGNACD